MGVEAQSLVERYAHRVAPAESGSACDAFSTINPQHGHEIMLDFRRKNGDRLALPYTYLTAITFDPSMGIKLEYTGHQVIIKGRNLEPIYLALLGYRATWLQEQSSRHDIGGDDATFISALEIERV
ncbi:MAG: hypothetical protein KJ057_16760 [Phycisphaerae bacterium]|nr:MAG: hypothetical protein EDS66_14100 [Planctomycetota bacterium]MBE7457356.1 hypothetical protein [Planctomycetia bacterium]MCL4720119.1 hypothetical protein [Phycisphaerae bacterium]